MKNILRFTPLLLIFLLQAGCNNEGNITEPETPPVVVPPINVYQIPPPTGKLPYPIHDPEFNQQQYDNMVNTLFIINNFGQDQFRYLHDGLDFVAPNGTKIFAIDSGYVRAIDSNTEYYKYIVIEDKNHPGYMWMYIHTDSFTVKAGDFVPQGKLIAQIRFQGVEHIHLTRAKLRTGTSDWKNYFNYYSLHPDKYFYYVDSKAPLIKRPFFYFVNNSDTMFHRGEKPVLMGEVDIVAGIRETGEYAKQLFPGTTTPFGDRLAVSKITYSVITPMNEIYQFNSYDFTKMIYPPDNAAARCRLLYKNYILLEGRERQGMEWGDYFSYYILTNTSGTKEEELINPADASLAWDTAELNTDGTPKYPNGTYVITITAFDYAGNSATESDTVEVRN